MALTPSNDKHKRQIAAGSKGREKGHFFEKEIVDEINKLHSPDRYASVKRDKILYWGNPGECLLSHISKDKNSDIRKVKAYWLGGLATAKAGDSIIRGEEVKGSKSDILLDIEYENGNSELLGVSVKSCTNNAQMALTSASVFCKMLRENGIAVSKEAEDGLRMFCGDVGFRPIDHYIPYNAENIPTDRKARPERWYWEELSDEVQSEWENIFNTQQVEITKLLMQRAKAYKQDKFKPVYLIHECREHEDIDQCEMAIMSIDEFALYSQLFDKFGLKEKRISKGTYKGIDMALHKYPHFGFIQFQPIGNKQNFSELQFNLMAGYYKKIQKMERDN